MVGYGPIRSIPALTGGLILAWLDAASNQPARPIILSTRRGTVVFSSFANWSNLSYVAGDIAILWSFRGILIAH
jgi:hypothetical protein